MNFSLYDALVPSWLQILRSACGLMHKADTHCKVRKIEPARLIDARLATDMYPLGRQVKCIVTHSVGAIEAVRQGACTADRSPWPDSFSGLSEYLELATARLLDINPTEFDAFMGRTVQFEVGSYKAEFLAENFWLSYSQPNFYFHATTAYDILRAQGLPIGKIDFLGNMRCKI
ncbi:MAG TPA: DUF1993 domain-containing protein [Paraburkholderia sp.]|uniref:DUF1993 domain-containing protein n=1 Tax=Paraburkholderia sp. TaxID=1926495 RepID=UPI002B47788E|nr:DUF1993 domain-containing protein [Paraburkholderia sp.]HKR38295.1 DUF1993 domain-containing protein [Paraburkholderia sp.]